MIAARYHVNQALQKLVDLMYMTLPRPRPTLEALRECKLVSHRGEHDNRRIRENTMAAFARVQAAGVWGIEFDVRWTRDLEPVVLHDPDTRRVFGPDIAVAEVELHQLRQRLPEVPTLAEVIERFGGEMHLMVEIKADDLGAEARKRARIEELFAGLSPVDDYHFLALAPELFALVEFAGSEACVPVAELNVADISRAAREQSFAGISGQYLLMSDRLIRQHRQLQQKVGTGFTASRFCFYRELNRGVDWIFTNHALKLAAIRQSLMRDG
jgi:glycerophosphoryl diester phosphodiesterase